MSEQAVPSTTFAGDTGEARTFCTRCLAVNGAAARYCSKCGGAVSSKLPSVSLRRPAGLITLVALHAIIDSLLVWAGVTFINVNPWHGDRSGSTSAGLILLVIATFGIVTAIGLWRLRPWGRYFQILLSIGGLIAIPFGTLLAAFSLFWLFTRRATIVFSGRRSDELAQSDLQLVQGPEPGIERALVTAMILAALAGALIGAIPLAKQPVREAQHRARQKETMEAMQNIANALERYARKHREYPKASGIEALMDSLAEVQREGDPPLVSRDRWDSLLWYATDNKAWNYWLVSSGSDLDFERDEVIDYRPGLTHDVDDDLVMKNSEFMRYPDKSE